MRVAKKILDFYINSSIHVALAVVSLTVITMIHLDIKLDKSLLFFVFFGTITGYNFVKYAKLAGLHHRSLARSLKAIQFFSLLSFTGLLISALYVKKHILFLTGIFGLFTLLYALPIFNKQRNLRSISGIKIFIIAFVWAGVTVVLPGNRPGNTIFGPLLIEFVQRFVLVLAWILPFEIRDLKYDLEQLGTIPQRVGVTNTKILGITLLCCAGILEMLKPASPKIFLTALLIMLAISGIFMWKSGENQSRYFTAFWVEAIPVIWLLILLLLMEF